PAPSYAFRYTPLLAVGGTEFYNRYRFTVYPRMELSIDPSGITLGEEKVFFAHGLAEAARLHKEGKKVIWFPPAEGKLEGTYCTDFWCYPMFRSISESMNRPLPVGTMGCLIEKDHPALAAFPTEIYSTPEWFEIVMHSHCEELTGEEAAIVRVIDNPDRAKNFGLLYEIQTETGTLLVCTARLWEAAEKPEVRRFAESLFRYLTKTEESL
ncbi:MAG: hypothetical protein K2N29_04630, partial [Ruminiclostridium sp.]|nr:hypothetical protein [Ruminiclostridium sp.]